MFFFNNKIKQAKKLVIAFGTFDYLHAGHENFLKQAKALGDYLLVVLARDNTIQSVKGKAPLYQEKKRLEDLRKTKWADQVILGSLDNKYQAILDYNPAIIALGYDQFVFTQSLSKILIENHLNAEIIRLEPYFPQVYKSSLLKQNEKIAQTQTQYI